jgi:hypothetical protein
MGLVDSAAVMVHNFQPSVLVERLDKTLRLWPEQVYNCSGKKATALVWMCLSMAFHSIAERSDL